MKKISIILAIATIFTAGALFVGCKDDADSKDTSNATSEVVSEASSEKASEATSEDVSETTSETTSEGVSETTSETTSDGVSETTSEATSEDVSKDTAPEGYKTHTEGKISFAYPEGWAQVGAMFMDSTGNGNNISVAAEPLTNMYKTMTVEKFNQTIAPQFSAMGITASDVAIEQKTNANGEEISVITYTATSMGVSMAQTILCVNASDATYAVTVTEVVEAPQLVAAVLESVKVVG